MKLTAIVSAIVGTVVLSLAGALYITNNAKEQAQAQVIELQTVVRIEKQRQKDAKKKADAQHKKAAANLAAADDRLRNTIANSKLPTDTGSSELACFNREEFNRAIRNFVSGTATIAGKGAKATIELDSAKLWAQGLKWEPDLKN